MDKGGHPWLVKSSIFHSVGRSCLCWSRCHSLRMPLGAGLTQEQGWRGRGGEDNWRLNLGELHTGVSSPGPRLALLGAVAFYLNRNGSQRLVSVTSLCVPSAP